MKRNQLIVVICLMICMLFMIRVYADSMDGTAYAVLTNDGELILFRSTETYTDGVGQTVTDINGNSYTGRVYTGIETTNANNASDSKWYDQRSSIISVRVANGQTIKPVNCCCWFSECSNCKSINLAGLDTENVTNMSQMFYGCSGLTNLDLSSFNTENVTRMDWMFYGCSGLTSLNISSFNTAKVTNMYGMFWNCSGLTNLSINFNTGNVTDMKYMFCGCNGLTSLNITFNTGNVTDMSYMFYGCSGLTSLDLTSFNTQNVTNMSEMFRGCSGLISLDTSHFDTGNVTTMYGMFCDCNKLTSLDLSNFNTEKVTTMSYMFYGCSGLTSIDVSSFNTGNVTTMSYMFYGCRGLTSLNISSFNTSNVTNMDSMFSGCNDLTSLDLSSFNTGNVTSMSSMFAGCSGLTSLDLSSFNTGNVTSMGEMFRGCSGLTSLDISSFNTAKVTSMYQMFYGCSGLTSLDLSNFNTGNVMYMGGMFYGCSGLTSIDVSSFNTGNVTDMNVMFYGCSGLTYLSISFNTGNVTNMGGMFQNCSRLTSLDLSNFDTGNVTSMGSMFSGCSGLTNFNVGGFNTGNVTNMYRMFSNCSGLTSLDLSSFNTSKVTDMSYMFSGCIKLTCIDLSSFDTEMTTNMRDMFFGCYNLTNLDLRNFNTRNARSMDSMFSNCTKLSSVILGLRFSFKGNSLPIPPSNTVYTGKWIKEDKTAGPYTVTQLANNYTPSMEGKWVWEIDSESSIIIFDANGGFVEPQSISRTVPFSAVEFPLATRLTYNHISWTLNRDGTGDPYFPGHEYNLFDKGNSITLYAQWERQPYYTVDHYQQKLSLDGYDLFETEQIYTPDETVEVSYRSYDGYIDPEPQTIAVAADNSSVANYYYDRTRYTVHYEPNGGAGSIPDQQMIGDYAIKLMNNRFERDGYWFTGWNTNSDGTETGYGDVQTVKNLANNGETFNLYAQWIDISTAAMEPTEGKYTIQINAGETITIPNIPSGTRYTIKEVNNPDGWSQTGEILSDGTIKTNTVSNSKIQNSYSATGTVQLYAYKIFINGELNPGNFSFELLQNGSVIQTKKNGEIDLQEEIPDSNDNAIKNPYYGMSKIVFDDISFNTTGNYTYTIREVNKHSEGIAYDSHIETVTVHVTDNHDGTLSCVPEYDWDGPVFTNTRIPVITDEEKTNDLYISKTVSNKNTNDRFGFNVTLTDANGIQINNPYQYDIAKTQGKDNYRNITKFNSSVSHTENINDKGEKISNYGNSWGNSNIQGTGKDSTSSDAHVITIPGAESLHVRITYGGESASWDWACVWEGSHPEYTADNNYSSSISGKLGGGNSTSSSNTREYTITGDSVTFSFRSDGGGIGDGYGYYAVVTAPPIITYTSDYISSGVVSSGQTIQISNNQTAVIHDIPVGVLYTVKELPEEGYTLTNLQDTEGSISESTIPEAKFTNVYNANCNSQIQLRKEFIGGTLQGGEFEFELHDSTGKTIQIVKNNSDGEIIFDPIEYTYADVDKFVQYTISEKAGDHDHIQYDQSIKSVLVEVTDNGNGTLGTTITYDSNTFTNRMLYDVPIRKVDITGNSLNGAKLTVTGKTSDNQNINSTTIETASQIVKLPPGTYTLHEERTPDNTIYDKADDIEFTVTETGTIEIDSKQETEVVMVDSYTTHQVEIEKLSPAGNKLAGAELQITGTETGDKAITPITWTSEQDKNKNVELRPGDYTLTEITPPTGFLTAVPINFTVQPNGTIQIDSDTVSKISMNDEYDLTGTITLSKTVNPETDNTVFTFNVSITEDEPQDTSKWKLNGNPLVVTQQTQGTKTIYTFTVQMKHGDIKTITGLHVGSEYTVTESNLPAQWISYESNSTGTISTDTMVSFQNIWMGILPATGFFNINNGTVRIAILLAIATLVIITLYPKKKKS